MYAINNSKAEERNSVRGCGGKDDGKNRQLKGSHLREKQTSLMAACLSFEITHKGRLHSVCGVDFSAHGSDGITRFIHQRSHTYRSNKAEGRQAACARGGGGGGARLQNRSMKKKTATFCEREAEECASWRRALQVFPARSWPRPQSEDCLLSLCQHATVSNRAGSFGRNVAMDSYNPPQTSS